MSRGTWSSTGPREPPPPPPPPLPDPGPNRQTPETEESVAWWEDIPRMPPRIDDVAFQVSVPPFQQVMCDCFQFLGF